jgi:hypothetical protein
MPHKSMGNCFQNIYQLSRQLIRNGPLTLTNNARVSRVEIDEPGGRQKLG